MSSNRNENASGRVSSIRDRLAWQRVRTKMGMHFWQYIFMMMLLAAVWLAARESTVSSDVPFFKRDRGFYVEKGEGDTKRERFVSAAKTLRYVVTDPADKDKTIFTEVIFTPVFVIIAASSMLFFLRLMGDLISYTHESNRIKVMFAPLDEIAQSVEELSKMELSEEKYHLIEEKITSLEPDAEAKLSFGDKDLKGIERAINNLLMRIRENNRQQARFVNDASHELRTPIAVIEGYANMLSRWGREDEKVLDESISAIKNESEHMKHLVEQLLFLARGDSGRTVLKREDVDLCEMVKTVYEESLMIDEAHIYKYQAPEETFTVSADEGLLKQAVRILVDNSAKYTKEKDEIVLSVGRLSDSEVYVQVQDTGIGMKEQDVEHMFERFYRSDEARSFGGTGLGLSIAKWIVDKHEGHFEITSREELGTRIRIVLKG